MKYFILFNPLAGGGCCKSRLDGLSIDTVEEKVFYDVVEKGYENLPSMLDIDDKIVICGGDGTVNRFINGIARCGGSRCGCSRYQERYPLFCGGKRQ